MRGHLNQGRGLEVLYPRFDTRKDQVGRTNVSEVDAAAGKNWEAS